jgi:ABC-type multidrug transport system fused ATPase/permease subunit
MNGTVRENILFGQQFDFKRYQRVLEMSALQHDLDSLPAADFTLVGERGPTLSGGM